MTQRGIEIALYYRFVIVIVDSSRVQGNDVSCILIFIEMQFHRERNP